MAQSYKTLVSYTLDSVNREFDIPYQYLARRFVVVTLIGANLEDNVVLTMGTDYRFVSKTRIQLSRAWGTNDGFSIIELRRVTSATDRLIDFSDGSILRAYDLNISQLQSLHIAEEGREQTAELSKQYAEDSMRWSLVSKGHSDEAAGYLEDMKAIGAVGAVSEALVSVKYPAEGSVYRTQRQKNMEVVTVTDFGAKGDGSTFDTSAFVNAARNVGQGGTVFVPAGDYLLKTMNVPCVNFVGVGQGRTVLTFDNSVSAEGIVFRNPTATDIEFGAQRLSVKTKGGHGVNAFVTPRGAGMNGLRLKPTFRHLSFYSQNTNAEFEGFSQTYSWKFLFNLGDSWQLTIDRIDAVGSYQAKIPADSQFLDGFMRTEPSEGILSMRVSNVTSHNIANWMEIKQKTYFALENIDVARAWNGIYDAPDRVLETNRSAYGESVWTNVIINAQNWPVKLDSRFLLIWNGGAIHRALNAHDHGRQWVGLSLSRARSCFIQGLEVGTGRGYTGEKVGIQFDAGDNNSIVNATFGLLDVCLRVGLTDSAYGAAHSVNIQNFGVIADVGKVLDLQSCRMFHASGFGRQSSYLVTTFVTSTDSNNTHTFSNIERFSEMTLDSLVWNNPVAGANEKNTRISLLKGMTIATQLDTGGLGNNFLIAERTGVNIDRVELRTKTDASGYIMLNSPQIQFTGFGKPTSDNTVSWGTAAYRWSTGYFASGIATTSDRNYKSDEEWLSDAEKAVALKCKSLIKRYKYRDAVDAKGDSARFHIGAIAQDIEAAFKEGGLNPDDYGIIVWEEWEETIGVVEPSIYEDGELVREAEVVIPYRAAGGAYSLRYDELAMFILSAI